MMDYANIVRGPSVIACNLDGVLSEVHVNMIDLTLNAVDDILMIGEFIRRQHGTIRRIPDDDYFELMMRNAWHIAGGWKLRVKKNENDLHVYSHGTGYITHLQMAIFPSTTLIAGDSTARQWEIYV